MADETTFEPIWAILEIFGHSRFAGLVGEQTIAGDKLLRLDIPAVPETREKGRSNYHPTEGVYAKPGHTFEYDKILDAAPAETKFFGVKAIYCMSPCTEERARAEAARLATRSKRIENVVEVSVTPLIVGDVAEGDPEEADGYPVETTYSCEREDCTNEQTFSGYSVAATDSQARAAGWNIRDIELGEEHLTECPTCYQEPL